MAETSHLVVGASKRFLQYRAKPYIIARMTKMSLRDELLSEIDAFLERADMTDSRFGVEAMGDPSWLMRFRAGSDPRIGTVDHLRRFMLTYRVVKRPSSRACARACA